MTYIPAKTKKAQHLSLFFILTGFAAAAISSVLSYKAISQLAAIVLIVIGVQLLTRYVLSDFRYILDDRDDGTSELIVYKRQGKRDVKVCHVSLAGVIEIYKYKEKKVESDTRFNYCQNLTDGAYVLHMRDGEKSAEIIIEPDAAFLDAIKMRAGHGNAERNFAM